MKKIHDIHVRVLGQLFEKMTAVRQIRYQIEGFEVNQSKFINEALEMYLNAKPNRQLLQECSENGTAKTRKAKGD